MPKLSKELGALEVKRLNAPGLHAVGGVSGLCLNISATGARSWILRTTVGGNRREIGLGAFPEVSLADARVIAKSMKLRIKDGNDPVEERRAARAALIAEQKRGISLADAYDTYITTKKFPELSNAKHRKQWRSTFDTYVAPLIGEIRVHELTVTHIRQVLDPIWASKTETASRIRGRLEEVLEWAKVSGHRDGENPARWQGNLKEMLAAPSKIKKERRRPALALADAQSWFEKLRKLEGTGSRALEFLTLTVSRSGEVRGALWSEFDFENGIWIVPAVRMKARRDHRVPLTDPIIQLIRSQPRMAGSDYVFTAPRGGQLSDMTLSATMRRMHQAKFKKDKKGYVDQVSGHPAVPHGLRSTFRDWAAERTSYPRDMAEMALAHFVGSDVERAYRRGDMLDKRREMMRAWGNFLMDK